MFVLDPGEYKSLSQSLFIPTCPLHFRDRSPLCKEIRWRVHPGCCLLGGDFAHHHGSSSNGCPPGLRRKGRGVSSAGFSSRSLFTISWLTTVSSPYKLIFNLSLKNCLSHAASLLFTLDASCSQRHNAVAQEFLPWLG